MNRYTIIFTAAITFMLNETMIVTAQERLTNQINSTNSDNQKITVTCLEANNSKLEVIQ
jgi:hypothetical protein